MALKRKQGRLPAFTLIELMVVIAIISLLLGLLVPSLQKARRLAISLLSSNHQRTIVMAVSTYAADNRDRFPDSVATLGTESRWSWREPTVLIGFQKRDPRIHRSVSEYLDSYIENVSCMFCPSAPSTYEFAQEAWEAGDTWNNPDPDTDLEDPLFGNYCLYWNYVGYLEGQNRPFVGPRSSMSKKTESKLLISDYFGYGHWRNELTYGSRTAYGSCEKFADANITKGTSVACDFWSLYNFENKISVKSLKLTFNAGYVDGHVEKFHPRDVLTMKVSMTPDGRTPYPDNVGPAGTFYLPRDD